MQLKYKENWTEMAEHTDAFWRGEYLDRPLTLLTAPRESDVVCPEKPGDLETMWTDIDYLIKLDEYHAATRHWLGDIMPLRTVMLGWCLNFGFPVEFRPDTIWFEHSMTELPDTIDWAGRWQDQWWDRAVGYMEQACRYGQDKYFVGPLAILPANDLLSVFRGTENFLLDLIDKPEVVKRHLRQMTDCHLEMRRQLQAIRETYYEGTIHGYPIWCSQRVGCWQSDVSCMVSPDMFTEFIMPELLQAASQYDKMIYHLDGPGAIQHVEQLCTIPQLQLIQWVPGSGQPHGAYWMSLFKKIQSLGKAVLIYTDQTELEALVKELDPALTVLQFGAKDRESGLALLDHVRDLTKRYH